MRAFARSVAACGVAACVLSLGAIGQARADAIPYPGSGSYNATTYTFTATAPGDVIAYFVGGGGAAYTNEMGLMVNGVQTPAGFGLNNHTSAIGQSFNLGTVNAGDTLVFMLNNHSLGQIAYSDPSMNVPYDFAGETRHNHIYSTPYTTTGPVFPGVPAGTYVAFEDLRFPESDFNYNDEAFVFTNVSTTPSIPEPGSLALLAGAILPGLAMIRRRKTA